MLHFLNPRSGNLVLRSLRPDRAARCCSALQPVHRTVSATAVQARQAGPRHRFQKQILPIFALGASLVITIHEASGLSLESAAAVETGGSHGPVVVPGQPTASRLYRRVARIGSVMPMDGTLCPNPEVILLKTWIEQVPSGQRESSRTHPGRVFCGRARAVVGERKLFKEKGAPLLSARCGNCHMMSENTPD